MSKQPSCADKKAYDSRSIARRALINAQDFDRACKDARVYSCHECPAWHITTKKELRRSKTNKKIVRRKNLVVSGRFIDDLGDDAEYPEATQAKESNPAAATDYASGYQHAKAG